MYPSDYKKPFRILLVDDNHLTLKIMGKFLEKQPYEVFKELNAEDSLKLLEKQEIDIIFSDHSMPGMTGIEFLEKIAGRYPEIIRVLVTGKAEFNDLIYAINNADLYRIIIKPINRIDFLSIVETAEEISKKRYLETLLIQSEKRFENLVNSMLDAVIVTAPNGFVKYVNPFAEKLWGKTNEEFAGNYFKLPQVKVDSTEIDIHCSDKGLRTGDLRTYDIFWQGEKALLTVVRDITERKEIENQLKDTIEKLSKANDTILKQQKIIIEEEKLELILQMSGATAHELSQPHTVLMGNIEILKHKDLIDNRNSNRFDSIYTAAEKISSIVRKFQAIRYVDSKQYTEDTQIINIDQKLSILYVNENLQRQTDMDDGLSQLEINLHCVSDIKDAIQILHKESFDLIIWASNHRVCNSMILQKHLKKNSIESSLIVILRETDPILTSKLFQQGVEDVVIKSELNPDSLRRIVSKNIEILKLKKEIGLKRDKLLKISQRDINSGLYNHTFFLETLNKELKAVKKDKNKISLCLLKIDKYNAMRKKYSKKEIDRLVKIFSQNLVQLVNESDIPCIYDENLFAVIMPDTALDEAKLRINNIKSNLENISFFMDDNLVKISLKNTTISSEQMDQLTEKNFINFAVNKINRP